MIFVLGSHVRHIAVAARTSTGGIDPRGHQLAWVPLCRQRAARWRFAATPEQNSRPICAYCLREARKITAETAPPVARVTGPPAATTTTDAHRAKPEVDQTWAWGDLLCRVVKVTRKYAHLQVSDGNGSWFKRQPLPLADSFELWW